MEHSTHDGQTAMIPPSRSHHPLRSLSKRAMIPTARTEADTAHGALSIKSCRRSIAWPRTRENANGKIPTPSCYSTIVLHVSSCPVLPSPSA